MKIDDWIVPYRAHFPSHEWQAEVQDRIERSRNEYMTCAQQLMVAGPHDFNAMHTRLEHAIECLRYACAMRESLVRALELNVEPLRIEGSILSPASVDAIPTHGREEGEK